MVSLETRLVSDIPYSPEQPCNVTLVVLPETEIPLAEQYVRLAMHTDNIRGLLEVLRSLPNTDRSLLQIEGRVLTDEEFARLSQHRVYRFFMSGRLQRVSFSEQAEILAYVLPRDFDISTEEASRLVTLPFSPSSLARNLGFKTGYYDADVLVEQWLASGNPNRFIPMLGACNEFNIGSDILSGHRLEEIAAKIRSSLAEAQTWVSQPWPSSLARLANIIPLSTPFNDNSKIIFNNLDFKNYPILTKDFQFQLFQKFPK